MDWFVFIENYGKVFSCHDDTEGKQKVLDFLTKDMPREYGVSAEENDDYCVVRGEECVFVPPSSKGDLI